MNKIYSNLKVFQFPEHLAALRTGDIAAPVHVRIKPMNYCNHTCWYCAYRTDAVSLGDNMDEKDIIPFEKLQEITDDLISMGTKAVTFSGGGEPLLYKKLPVIIEKLGRAGLKVGSLTNGDNLKGKMAEAFAKYGTWVRVSMDSWDDASHAKSRGSKGQGFTRLMENMRAFADMGTTCELGVSFIIDKTNHVHIEELCTTLKANGVRHVKLTGAIVGNGVRENNEYHDPIREEIGRQMKNARKALQDENFQILDHYHEVGDLFVKEYKSCPMLTFLTVIGADCNVYTCQDKAYTTTGILGSIKDRSFKEFWFSDEARERIHGVDPSKNCFHHCISHNKNVALSDYAALDPDHGQFV
jgi:MoaA/NifB/PqqE/SkfB family radical SAM enzyme